jgi:hypothetical protein
MTESMNLEERLEAMAVRLERVEKINRLLKIWGTIAIVALIGSGPFASNVIAKPAPKVVTASAFNLVSSGKTVASLSIFNGQPSLVFFDNAGKTVMGVGIDGALTLPTGHGVGIGVYDGNADIPGTGKIRAAFGVTPSGPLAGVGAQTFDGNGELRSAIGATIDSSVELAFFFDGTGTLRNGLVYDPATNFNGSFSNDASGNGRSSVGSAVDGSYSGEFISDAAGKLRDQILYIPSGNFNGFQSYDGANHNLSSLGNFLVDNAALAQQANESFMLLSDTSLPRVFEFQDSTNEGGVDYDPGKFPTFQGGWGNP